jgi:CubicO group peptidase (beta-lactamase class C family)
MYLLNLSLRIIAFGILSVSFSKTIFAQSADNPTYSAAVEARIERITANLQPKENAGQKEGKPLLERLKHYKIPGVSIAVINNGKLEWARGFGNGDSSFASPVDNHTLFQAASISKPITALTIMRLTEQGRLNLDADVNQYLRSWKVPPSGQWQPLLSLRQILSHTAGLTVNGFSGYKKTDTLPSHIQILKGERPSNSPAVRVDILPGTRVRYSGGGTLIAQQVIEDVMRKSFPEIVEEVLFTPLGLGHSTFQQPLPERLIPFAAQGHTDKGNRIEGGYHIYPEMAPAGLWTTPSDLCQLFIEVQQALKGQSKLFQKATIEEMLQPLPVAISRSTALGFFLEGPEPTKRFRHNGWNEGYVSKFEVYKQGGKGAVIMTNSDAGHGLIDELFMAIASEYGWKDFDINTAAVLTKEEAAQLVGTYSDYWSNEYRIQAGKNSLWLLYENQPPISLYKRADGGFKSKDFSFIVRFEGSFLILDQEGVKQTYKKVALKTEKKIKQVGSNKQ